MPDLPLNIASAGMPPVDPEIAALVPRWLDALRDPAVVADLEQVYALLARDIAARGPACWASGRCCNFERAGHRLYTTGLEAAYTASRAGAGLTPDRVALAISRGNCPYQSKNLCGVHPDRPLGCRVYFCDRSAQQWQHELSEHGLAAIRDLHDRHGVPYLYAEWRTLLAGFASESAG